MGILHVVSSLVNTLITAPSRFVYDRGPRSWGFWQGLPQPDVCSKLTGVSAAHWALHGGECAQQIDNDFVAWQIKAAAAVAVVLVLHIYGVGCYYVMVVRPAVQWRDVLLHALTASGGSAAMARAVAVPPPPSNPQACVHAAVAQPLLLQCPSIDTSTAPAAVTHRPRCAPSRARSQVAMTSSSPQQRAVQPDSRDYSLLAKRRIQRLEGVAHAGSPFSVQSSIATPNQSPASDWSGGSSMRTRAQTRRDVALAAAAARQL